MAPLQKIIETFCFQQKPQMDVSGCQLFYQKKLLDPTTPVRFTNLPKEAKLELVTGIASDLSFVIWHLHNESVYACHNLVVMFSLHYNSECCCA